jgi:hypothetical protein
MAFLWWSSRDDGLLADVRFESVHTDDLGAAADLEGEPGPRPCCPERRKLNGVITVARVIKYS